jgi:type II secretory pathway pseudopilin PulG
MGAMKNFQPKKSFTLIETIVVIAVIAIVIPAVFSIIFSLIYEQTKVYHLTQVKREGDYALRIMQTVIRNNAVTIYSSCSNLANPTIVQCPSNSGSFPVKYPTSGGSDGSNFCFQDKNTNGFSFAYDSANQAIASNSSILNTGGDLTSNKVAISNFSIKCLRTAAFSPPVITVSYDVGYNSPGAGCSPTSSRAEDIACLHYQTNIQLRSY